MRKSRTYKATFHSLINRWHRRHKTMEELQATINAHPRCSAYVLSKNLEWSRGKVAYYLKLLVEKETIQVEEIFTGARKQKLYFNAEYIRRTMLEAILTVADQYHEIKHMMIEDLTKIIPWALPRHFVEAFLFRLEQENLIVLQRKPPDNSVSSLGLTTQLSPLPFDLQIRLKVVLDDHWEVLDSRSLARLTNQPHHLVIHHLRHLCHDWDLLLKTTQRSDGSLQIIECRRKTRSNPLLEPDSLDDALFEELKHFLLFEKEVPRIGGYFPSQGNATLPLKSQNISYNLCLN